MHNSLWFQGVDDLSQRPELEKILRESDISVIVSPENTYALKRGIHPLICVRKEGEGYFLMPFGLGEKADYFINGKMFQNFKFHILIRGRAFRLCQKYVPIEESDDSLAQTFFNNPHFTK